MQNLLYGLLKGLIDISVPLVKKVMIALGIGSVTYGGLFALLDQVSSYFQLQLSGLPADVLALIGIMKIDIAFTMIMSAITANTILRGWSSLTDRKKSLYY